MQAQNRIMSRRYSMKMNLMKMILMRVRIKNISIMKLIQEVRMIVIHKMLECSTLKRKNSRK